MYSRLALDHIQNPRSKGEFDAATHRGNYGEPGGGPYTLLWLEIDEGVIKRATYDCNGCPASIACASFIAEWCVGKDLDKAATLERPEALKLLGGLPDGREDAMTRALTALANAKPVTQSE